jgi:hypothetical protein
VSWQGTGGLARVKDRFQVKTPGFKLNFRYNGTFRGAQASGVVANNGTNFAPGAAVFANLGSVRVGELVVTR